VAVIDHRFESLHAEREVLSEVGAELIDLRDAPLSRVLEVASTADAILLGARFEFDRTRLARLTRCRVIARYGVGVDNIDLAAAAERGIVVTAVPDYCVEEVANHAIALLLALHRQVVEYDQAIRGTRVSAERSPVIPRLSDCTLGILGFGRIGAEVARRASALGLSITVHDPITADAAIRQAGCEPLPAREVIRTADFLSLHVPLNVGTRHLLDAETIGEMRSGSIIINVSRGGLIDEEALADGIESGHLGGAGLDVTESEPLPPGHRLLSLPRVILTPHVAWLSSGARAELQRKTAEEALTVLRGDSPRHPASH
jgi:D-3-phosphoglycerate dehydrogenase